MAEVLLVELGAAKCIASMQAFKAPMKISLTTFNQQNNLLSLLIQSRVLRILALQNLQKFKVHVDV